MTYYNYKEPFNWSNHLYRSIPIAWNQTKNYNQIIKTMTTKAIKTGPKRTAISTVKPDQRHRDNKGTPSNTPSLKPSKWTTKKSN